MAIIGANGRGSQLLQGFSALEDVEIAYVCDPDLNVVPGALKKLPARHKRQPKVVQDMRRIFTDKDVQAVAIAAPDHWHALATVWACQAGKHVYVEEPVSHNLVEGRRMVQAARKYERVVEVGAQRAQRRVPGQGGRLRSIRQSREDSLRRRLDRRRPQIHWQDKGQQGHRARLITTSGWGPLPSGHSTPIGSTTTGTGTGTTAPANWATTEFTASTWSAGCSPSTRRGASPLAGASSSTTTISRLRIL